jgi:hypothetical protein
MFLLPISLLSGHPEDMLGLIMIGLVNVAFWIRRTYFPHSVSTLTGVCHASHRPKGFEKCS